VPHLKVGNVFTHISEIITSYDFDLIVMGTQGVSGIEEMVIGSNTEKVVRTANCPVLAIRRCKENFDIKNLVIATDLENISGEFLGKINELQQVFGFNIHIVYINTPGNFRASSYIDAKLEEIQKKHLIENATLNTYNALDEEQGIREFAKKMKADVIAMTTHGRKGLASIMWGSISEDLVNQSVIPVMTFRTNIKKKNPDKVSVQA
jgi:nucleotide-binding universal stress UspA family protein